MYGRVTIATFAVPWEAHILRGRLEAEGFPTFVIDKGTGGTHQISSIKLQVQAADAERAREIMREGRTL